MILRINRRTGQAGFTLIELLVTIAIVAILAGLGLGVYDTVRDRGRISRSQGELTTLASALQQYQTTHGDYPWVRSTPSSAGGELLTGGALESAQDLYRALIGHRLPEKGGVRQKRMKAFIEPSRFQVTGGEEYAAGELRIVGPSSNSDALDGDFEENFMVDAWGNPYIYAYKRLGSPGGWEASGYILFSMGPDGDMSALPANGQLDESFFEQPENLDNIYFDR